MYAINILSDNCDVDSLIHVESSSSIVLQAEKKNKRFHRYISPDNRISKIGR